MRRILDELSSRGTEEGGVLQRGRTENAEHCTFLLGRLF
jgi:hypothetical protein